MLIAIIVYLEYRVIQSIAKDRSSQKLNAMILSYIRNRKLRRALIAASQWKVMDMIFRRINAGFKQALAKTARARFAFSKK